jgi:glycosyltransferase involved in cell wall biosynthesis
MLSHNTIWRSNFFRAFYFGRQLVAMGHHVTIIAIAKEERIRSSLQNVDGVEVYLAPDLLWGMGRSGWDPWDTWNRLRFIHGRHFDLVHAFDSRPAVIHPARAYRRRTGVPLVMDWADWWGRGGVISMRANPVLKYGFKYVETFYEEHFRSSADWNTTISKALAGRAVGLGVPRSRITVLPAGADLDYFKPIPRDVARDRLGLPLDVPILAFGGFVQWDIHQLIATFEFVQAELPKTLLLLCGPLSNHTRKWKVEHPVLAPNIIEKGVVAIEDMPYHLAAADALILPLPDSIANRGRFPNKLGEYLAMGKVVITNHTGDVGELLARTGAAALAPDDPSGFADVVVATLKDPELRRDIECRARTVALEELDYRLLARQLVEVYEGVSASA